MTRSTMKIQATVIEYMLERRYPDLRFSVRKRKAISDRGHIIDRWIEIIYDSDDLTKNRGEEIQHYVDRYLDSPPDRKGNVYTRSYWVNGYGRARLGIVRKNRTDGTSSIVEREKPPTEGGPYTLHHFTIQRYTVEEARRLKSKPYALYDDD